MAIDWKNDEIGALWKRRGKKGVFLSGFVEVEDGFGKKNKMRVILFQNKFKEEGDKKPDFNVYKGEESFNNDDNQNPMSPRPKKNNNSSDTTSATKSQHDEDGFVNDDPPL